MPKTKVIIYKEASGEVPLLSWMDGLPRKVVDKWTQRFEMLEDFGHDLRRPTFAPLRDKIYELRVDRQRVHYRVLCGFVDQDVVLLSHGCFKEGRVPDIEINKAIANRQNYLDNPAAHEYIES